MSFYQFLYAWDRLPLFWGSIYYVRLQKSESFDPSVTGSPVMIHTFNFMLLENKYRWITEDMAVMSQQFIHDHSSADTI